MVKNMSSSHSERRLIQEQQTDVKCQAPLTTDLVESIVWSDQSTSVWYPVFEIMLFLPLQTNGSDRECQL